jgi:hypothetical protein
MKNTLTILFLFCSLLSIGQVCSINQGGITTNIGGKCVISGDLTYGFIHGVATSNNLTYTPLLTQNVALKLAPVMVVMEQDGLIIIGDTAIVPAGDYSVKIYSDIASQNNNDFKITIRTNNSTTAFTSFWRGSTTSTSNYTSIAYEWYLTNLTANTNISFWITNLTNNDDPVISRFKVIIEKKPE